MASPLDESRCRSTQGNAPSEMVLRCFLKAWPFYAGLLVLLGASAVFAMFLKQQRAYRVRTVCVSNLLLIRMAKLDMAQQRAVQKGASVTLQELQPFIGAKVLKCPSGGSYTIGPIGSNPTCSYTNECVTYTREEWHLRCAVWKHSL